MKLPHTEVKFYPEVKSQTGLSSLRVSCKRALRMEKVKKKLGFRSDSISHVEVYLPSMFCACSVETMKSCILSN